MEDTILEICTKMATDAMEETAKKDPMSRMVGVNILEKLKQELTTESLREQFVKEQVQHAKTYVQFNNTETSQGEEMENMIQVCIPKGNESTQAFRDELIKAFRDYTTGYNFDESCVSEHYKTNEIVVVTARSGFPLRYLANMTTLKEKYDSLLVGPNGNYNRMLLHTESFDDFDKVFPALFFNKPEEIMKEILPKLMMAYAFDLIQEQSDPVTGEKFVCIKCKDEILGCESLVPIKGAKDFGQAWRALGRDYGSAMKLKDQVEDYLKAQAVSNTQKAALKQKLIPVLENQVLNSLCEGNKFHTDYEFYKQVVGTIFNNELKEL
jgi:hypothetical protein